MPGTILSGIESRVADAVTKRLLLRFFYVGASPSYRVVEPHSIWRDGRRAVLRAWQREGGEGEGWCDFQLDSVSDLFTLGEMFMAPHDGYCAPARGRQQMVAGV